MCVGGVWCVERCQPRWVCVCVCVCVCVRACVFLPIPYKKRCFDVVYFVCKAHFGPSRGANEAVH